METTTQPKFYSMTSDELDTWFDSNNGSEHFDDMPCPPSELEDDSDEESERWESESVEYRDEMEGICEQVWDLNNE